MQNKKCQALLKVFYVIVCVIHAIVIVNFVLGIAYSCYQIFYVLQPAEIAGPLGVNALKIDSNVFFARRAYAIEAWVAISGFSVYIAIMTVGMYKSNEQ